MNSTPLLPTQVQDAWQALQDFAIARTTPELASIILAALAVPVLLMSYTRYARPSSPYSRSPNDTTSPKVSDTDFSYITSEDLQRGDYDAPNDSPRNTDLLTLVERGRKYTVHFPAHSIDREELSIGALRQQARKKLPHGAASMKKIKLFFRGKGLTDDKRSCRSEGIRHGSEVSCSLADASDDSDANSSDDGSRSPSKRKRKSAKFKKQKSQIDPSRSSANTLPVPSSSANPSRTPSPKPKTPAEILDGLRSALDDLVRACQDFKDNPPPTLAKRDFEQKRLGEMILTQVLLKLDAVDTDEPGARARRKELVRQAQDELKRLDEYTTTAAAE